MQEEITREYFNKRKEELYEKWKEKMTHSHESAVKFYRMNELEIFEDIDELYNMAITLSIKGE